MNIQLRRVAFGVGESDFVALLHQGANRNRQFVEVIASAGINLAIFQWQAVTARDEYQDFSFCCHVVLLFEIESVLLGYRTKTGDGPSPLPSVMAVGTRTSTTTDWLPNAGRVPSSD